MKKLVLFMLLLASCTSLPPLTAPGAPSVQAGKARVYVYRRAIPLGPADLQVYDGQRLIGALPSGSYLVYDAAPGPRVFKAVAAGTGHIPYATTLDAGQTYYFMAYLLGDQLSGDTGIAPTDSSSASAAIATLKLIDNKSKP